VTLSNHIYHKIAVVGVRRMRTYEVIKFLLFLVLKYHTHRIIIEQLEPNCAHAYGYHGNSRSWGTILLSVSVNLTNQTNLRVHQYNTDRMRSIYIYFYHKNTILMRMRTPCPSVDLHSHYDAVQLSNLQQTSPSISLNLERPCCGMVMELRYLFVTSDILKKEPRSLLPQSK